jgi:hypothetical protein
MRWQAVGAFARPELFEAVEMGQLLPLLDDTNTMVAGKVLEVIRAHSEPVAFSIALTRLWTHQPLPFDAEEAQRTAVKGLDEDDEIAVTELMALDYGYPSSLEDELVWSVTHHLHAASPLLLSTLKGTPMAKNAERTDDGDLFRDVDNVGGDDDDDDELVGDDLFGIDIDE